MNEKIINFILNEMSMDLDEVLLQKLKNCLTRQLHNVQLSIIETSLTAEVKGNDNVVNLFLISKHIEGRKHSTLEYYRRTIMDLLDYVQKDYQDITTDDIRYYFAIREQQKKISKITLDNIRRNLNSFFTWLENEDYIDKNPMRKIGKVMTERRVKKPFLEDELELLRDECENMRDLAIIDFLYSSAMRVGELIKLNRSDLQRQNLNTVDDSCIVFGKGSSERIIYLNAKAKVHLMKYLNSRTDDNDALFVTTNSPHTRLTRSGIRTILQKLGKKAHVSNVYPHRFRRTTATQALDRGMPIEQVQKMLGHKRIDTTMLYCSINESNLKISHRRYVS